MKKLLILSIALLGIGCGSNGPNGPQASLLTGANYAGQYALVLFGNQFTYQHCNIAGFQFPESGSNYCSSGCSEVGTFTDLTPGQTSGFAQFVNEFDTCNSPPILSAIRPYTVVNGLVTVTFP